MTAANGPRLEPAVPSHQRFHEWKATEYRLRAKFTSQQKVAMLTSDGPIYGTVGTVLSQDSSYGIEVKFNEDVIGTTPTTQWVSAWDIVDASNVQTPGE